jgi:phosphopantothenoylcysteine decarboxylase/phosphopantothenate--cysteine ligase
MTTSALEFITPLTLQALSTNPVHTELFDPATEAAMGHIELAKWADIILIAPATANTLAKVAHGIADNLLTTLILASEAPLFLAPAMNQVMWHNQRNQQNIKTLQQSGIQLLGPDNGEQACGDTGFGRMLEAVDIVEQLNILTSSSTSSADILSTDILKNLSILITAGPTREALDPVRYITNRSSGKMGYAIAQAAIDLGAKVTLISGPVNLAAPNQAETIQVESANEMFIATKEHAQDADIFIASAAVADYAAETVAMDKIKKTADELVLKLTKNPDILSEISHAHSDLFTVGFAAETTNLEAYAKGKLINKKLNMIAANQVGNNQGFDVDDNALKVIWGERKDQQTSLPLTSKTQLAHQLLELIAEHYYLSTSLNTGK